MAEVKITQENFEKEVINSTIPVIVDFWAPWCGPCQMLGPILAEVAAENSSFKVAKINVDEESALAERSGAMNIPTLAVFKEGKIVNSSVGVISKEAIVDLVK
mgnify:FL=1